jgi:hypothetical protein
MQGGFSVHHTGLGIDGELAKILVEAANFSLARSTWKSLLGMDPDGPDLGRDLHLLLLSHDHANGQEPDSSPNPKRPTVRHYPRLHVSHQDWAPLERSRGASTG